MSAVDISTESVREALRSLYYGHALDDSPLLDLMVLRPSAGKHLDQDGADVDARSWALGIVLDRVAVEELEKVRGQVVGEPDDAAEHRDAADDLAALRRDFRPGNATLEAWSILHFRYFSPLRLSVEETASELGVASRTLSRRLNKGHALLAVALQARERNALAEASPDSEDHEHGVPAPRPEYRLPRSPSHFVGRSDVLRSLAEALSKERVVTLLGPGGVGKTRVALELAHEEKARWRDGIVFLALDDVGEAAFVPSATAAAFGIEDEASADPVESLRRGIGDREILLIADNCEHLIEAIGTLVGTLVARCPRLVVLATSREPLRISGEASLPLAPLRAPAPGELARDDVLETDAAKLFLDRVRQVRGSLELDEESVRAIADICRRLDGLPLALELAAASTRAFPLRTVADRLDDRLRLLGRGDRAAAQRHQTLEAVMDWSWNLLDERERAFFARASVFVGGFTLEAAERVCADAVPDRPTGETGRHIDRYDVIDLLLAMVEKSLVLAPDLQAHPPRYRMLETLRGYGLRQLERAGGRRDIEGRHANHFADWLETTSDAASESWLGAVDAELGNLQRSFVWAAEQQPDQALRIAVALGEYWLLRGRLNAGRSMLGRALEMPCGDRGRRATLLNQAGRVARQQSDFENASALQGEALELWAALDDPQGQAATHRELGIISDELTDYDLAAHHYAESLAHYRALGDDWGRAAVENNLGLLAMHRDEKEDAERHLRASSELFRRLGARWALGITVANLANLAATSGRYEEAESLYSESLVIAGGQSDRIGVASNRTSRAFVRLQLGNTEAARDDLQRALPDLIELRDLRRIAESLNILALLSKTEERPLLAVQCLAAEAGLREEIRVPLAPSQRAEHEDLMEELRRIVGGEQLGMMWERGQQRGWRDVIEDLLGAA